MLLYSKEIIVKTCEWIDGEANAETWLKQKGHPELIELKVASLNNTKALENLLIHKHFILAAFVNAIWEDKKAIKLLLDRKEYVWAAMANIINGDIKATLFLEKNKLKHYVNLAIKIQAQIRKQGDAYSSIFSGPIK